MAITRRTLLGAGLLGVVTGAGLTDLLLAAPGPAPRRVAPLPAGRPRGGRPHNILLVVTDQERFDLPSALMLPGHERLRARGTRFTRYHVNTTPCSPSRSNLYFGQHTQKTRMTANLGAYPQPQLPADMPSLGDYLRANGYYTAYKGKWHLSDIPGRFELTYGRYPNSRDALEPYGFSDYNFDGDPHGSTWTGYKFDGAIAAQAASWLRERSTRLPKERPWMLAVNFVNPHDVMYFSTGKDQEKSRRGRDFLAPLAEPPDDPGYRRRWEAPLPANRHDDLRSKPWAHANYVDICNMTYGRMPPGDAAWRAYQDYYFNCIADADRHLQTVLDALEASGQADRTIVVFTSDHGEMAGAHGLRQKGPFIYQENTRVPLIISHPDIHGSHETTALGSAVDLVPTLLEMAGVDAGRISTLYPHLAGVSLVGALGRSDGLTERDRRGILFNYDTTLYLDSQYIGALIDHQVTADRFLLPRALAAGLWPLPSFNNPALFRGLHDGRYKFARYFRPSQHHRPADWQTLTAHNQLELYDTWKDPDELHNLASTAEAAKPLLMTLNERLNALVDREVGVDLGDELPGPGFLKRL